MPDTHPLGAVAHLWRYPVKSLAAEPLDAADVDARGLAGDRSRAVFVATPGHARSGKTYRGKEHPLFHTLGTADGAVALGAARDVALVVRDDGPFFDLDPVSVLFDSWLRDGERLVGRTLEPLRFRPNLFVTTRDTALAEADLVDRVLAIGGVRLRVTQPIRRCVTPTYDLRTGESDPSVLSTLANRRDNTMGVYAHVVRPGRIRCGDAVAFAGEREELS